MFKDNHVLVNVVSSWVTKMEIITNITCVQNKNYITDSVDKV